MVGFVNDEEPFKYSLLDKMVQDIINLTTLWLQWFSIFYSHNHTYLVTTVLCNTCYVVEGGPKLVTIFTIKKKKFFDLILWIVLSFLRLVIVFLSWTNVVD
jgi:hypothetical protein